MKAKELRIGNYVLTYLSDNADGIEQVTINTLRVMTENPTKKTIYEPIPLTEEWLINLGFENYRNTGNYKIKANEYWSLGELKQGYLKIKLTKAHNFRVENFGNKSLNLNTVHRLQNFFFALTGLELTLKEK